MTLRIDDSSHHFDIDYPTPVNQTLEFSATRLFATIAPGTNITALDASLNAGGSAFNNTNINHALMFSAECVVLMPKETSPQFPEQHILQNFEFGFVQGKRASVLNLDFWGRYAVHGRMRVDADMGSGFEVDTDTSIQPWTRVAAERFKLRNVTMATSKFNSLHIQATFNDHPMYMYRHTLQHPTHNVPNFIRQVSFKREFKTVFCFREKKTGAFTAVSSTGWVVHFNHFVNYTGNGATRNVTSQGTAQLYPRGGSPSDVDQTARQVLTFAKAGAPLVTAALITSRINAATPTSEDKNADFAPAFWA